MAQVDRSEGLVGNTAFKAPVRAATTVAVTLSGEQTINGIACIEGNRVLVKDQSVLNAAQNGIYVVSTGSWNRADDFDGSFDVTAGTMVTISEGTQANTYWILSTTGTITIGTTSLAFVQANHIETDIHGATLKATPVDADEIGFYDSVAGLLKNLTFANLWTWIQSKLAAPGAIGGTTPAAGSFTTLTATGKVSGATATGVGTSSAIVGNASGVGTGVYGVSASGLGVNGFSPSGYGVSGEGVYGVYGGGTIYGVYAYSSSGYALYVLGDTTSPAKAPMRIVPQDAAPTGQNEVGDLYVSSAGKLNICTVAGGPGTWTVVGTQT